MNTNSNLGGLGLVGSGRVDLKLKRVFFLVEKERNGCWVKGYLYTESPKLVFPHMKHEDRNFPVSELQEGGPEKMRF
jgi:hypothetical protein